MSKRMYKNSPTLESDESGKKYIKKNEPTDAEKKSAQVSDGTDGIQMHEVHAKQAKERFDLYQKHDKEFMDMYTRHQIEGGGADPGATGGEMISKIENNKGE